ncbi:MAG: SAM-dependent methyltransferase [Bacteroidota bacterium]|nr:SAM-dependent methyltransferase [Bacteroidota bacterium]
MAKQQGKLFLIPTPIVADSLESMSPEVTGIIHSIRYYIVEKVRTARRFVSAAGHPEKIDSMTFIEMPEDQSNLKELEQLLAPALKGENIGLMSEAGLPAIADPGNLYVRVAQGMGIEVVPLAGPSSLMMALMASGLEGQRFSFHGYLSAKKNELGNQLKDLEKRADRDDATQLFIETPYRNRQVLEVAAGTLDSKRRFCIAAGIGGKDGFVLTKTMADWKKSGWPEIHKIPAVFLIK